MNRALMIVVATSVFLVLAIYLTLNVQTFMGRMVLAASAGTVLLMKPELALLGAVVSGPMELQLPGFAGIFRLQHFFLFALFAYGILDTAVRKSSSVKYASARYLLGFAAVLLMIIAFRGIGFRVLGSESFGGADYVKVFLAIGGYWGGLKVATKEKSVKRMIVLSALGPLLPLAAQWLVSRRPELFYGLQRFVETSAQYLLSEAELVGRRGVTGGVGGRFYAAGPMATGLWILLWGKWGYDERGKRPLLYVALPLLAVLAMISGFRGNTVGTLLVGSLCLFLTTRSKMPAVIGGLAVGLALYVVLLFVGPHLPLPAQRALSPIPGVAWDASVMQDATKSVTWRVEVWRFAAQKIPDYLLLGRGMLLEDVYRVHAWRDWSYYASPEFFYATHSYHSGPLSLLLDTGILGFLAFLMFQISVVREAWRGWQAVKLSSDRFLRAVYYCFAVRATYMLFVFYFLYGDIKYNIFEWVITGLLLQKIVSSMAQPVLQESEVALKVPLAPNWAVAKAIRG